MYWFDRRAEQANLRHTYLRVIAIGGGVLIPGLVSVHAGSSSLWVWDWVRPLAFVVSLMVAAAVGLDEFYHFGERWRHFRRTAELLKAEGWLFIEGAGRYQQEQHRRNFHELFFPVFATKVEEIIRHDVEVYLTRSCRRSRTTPTRKSRRCAATPRQTAPRPDRRVDGSEGCGAAVSRVGGEHAGAGVGLAGRNSLFQGTADREPRLEGTHPRPRITNQPSNADPSPGRLG